MVVDEVEGASRVKYMENMFWCTKTIIFWVKYLKIIAMCCLNWIFFFYGGLYCHVRYLNIEYQDEIFKIFDIIKNITQKVMVEFGFGCRFHDLRYF